MTNTKHKGRVKMETQKRQAEIDSINPDALLSEAQASYQAINSLQEQVDGGVVEAQPQLEQAHASLQEILGIVDQRSDIDGQDFQAAMLGQPTRAELQAQAQMQQQQQAIAASQALGPAQAQAPVAQPQQGLAPVQQPDIYAPNPQLLAAKQNQGLGQMA